MMQRPRIGITLDHCTESSYSQYCDWYALRSNYSQVISDLGATPILLPYDIDSIADYITLCDGFVIPGGDYDIAPEHYGQTPLAGLRSSKDLRTAFESQLLTEIIQQHKPFVAICAGMQLLNVLQGGTLIQDLADRNTTHEQPDPHTRTAHPIQLDSHSKLFQSTGIEHAQVNSTHHQAILELGTHLTIAATAPDGVIEAIELNSHPFGLGIEWHPEYRLTELDHAIWRLFANALKS